MCRKPLAETSGPGHLSKLTGPPRRAHGRLQQPVPALTHWAHAEPSKWIVCERASAPVSFDSSTKSAERTSLANLKLTSTGRWSCHPSLGKKWWLRPRIPWAGLRCCMDLLLRRPSFSRRRTSRVDLIDGVSVYWRCNGREDVSRVRDLGFGGLFIDTCTQRPVGAQA